MENRELVIIGAGPAGLAAAAEAVRQGVSDILLLERNPVPGGILCQCIHDGFGVERFGTSLTGPEYIGRFLPVLHAPGVTLLTGAMALRLEKGPAVTYADATSLHTVRAGAVILATGCRERTRGAIRIPGTRPSGVYTAGVVQHLTNVDNVLVGKRAVILGSGDIGLIMARRLTLEGMEIVCVLEKLPYCSGLARNVRQCLMDYDIPLHLRTTVVELIGDHRLEAVVAAEVDGRGTEKPGTRRTIPCDTLILSVGLIPENELARGCGIELDPDTGGAPQGGQVPVEAGAGVRYVLPHLLPQGEGALLSLRVQAPGIMQTVRVMRGEERIAQRSMRRLSPAEMIRLPLPAITGTRPLTVELVQEERPQKLPEGELTCTVCPNGCVLTPVTGADGQLAITGALCKRGEAFGKSELTDPQRTLTTTVRVRGGTRPLLSVRTASPVQKGALRALARRLRDAEATAPVSAGQTVYETAEARVIATAAVEKHA